MPEVIVALYDSYGAAAHARTDLVAEGFPTDRVDLTARIDEGHAGVCVARTGEPARGA